MGTVWERLPWWARRFLRINQTLELWVGTHPVRRPRQDGRWKPGQPAAEGARGPFRVKVEDLRPEALVVSHPLVKRELVPVGPGAPVWLAGCDWTGRYRFWTRARRAEEQEVPLLVCEPVAWLERLQRRRAVRVPTELPVRLWRGEEETGNDEPAADAAVGRDGAAAPDPGFLALMARVFQGEVPGEPKGPAAPPQAVGGDGGAGTWESGVALDLSANGVRIATHADVEPGDIVDLKVLLPSGAVRARGLVHKAARYHHEFGPSFGVEFVHLPLREEARVSQYVFDRERELRRRGVL